jgi:hypothetical protein
MMAAASLTIISVLATYIGSSSSVFITSRTQPLRNFLRQTASPNTHSPVGRQVWSSLGRTHQPTRSQTEAWKAYTVPPPLPRSWHAHGTLETLKGARADAHAVSLTPVAASPSGSQPHITR